MQVTKNAAGAGILQIICAASVGRDCTVWKKRLFSGNDWVCVFVVGVCICRGRGVVLFVFRGETGQQPKEED